MSHVCAISLEIRDLDALKLACQQLGLEFREGQRTWKWFNRFVNDYHGSDAAYKHGLKPEQYGHSEHAIGLKDCQYEIGVIRTADGKGYSLAFDFWGPGRSIRDKLGAGCEKLKQRYGANVASKSLRAKGYRVKETISQDGAIVLRGVR